MIKTPEYEKLHKFMNYLTESYVDFEGKFSIYTWAKMKRSFKRITNAFKSLYSKFDFFIYILLRQLYIFYKYLKKIQVDT